MKVELKDKERIDDLQRNGVMQSKEAAWNIRSASLMSPVTMSMLCVPGAGSVYAGDL